MKQKQMPCVAVVSCCSVAVMSDSLWHHGLQHTRHPCLSPSPGVCSNSCPLSWWCHATISVVESEAKIIGVNEKLVKWSIYLHLFYFLLECSINIKAPQKNV